MQFRILPVAVVLFAVVVCVLAADPPTVDALHSKCYNHHDHKRWIAENEEVDQEAMKAFPSNYEAMGWRKYKSGKCTYKRNYVECPHKGHWHHDEDHWDRHYGFKRLNHACTLNSDCCSNNCVRVRNTTTPVSVCCKHNTQAWNTTCSSNWQCCSGKCNNVTVGGAKFCLEP